MTLKEEILIIGRDKWQWIESDLNTKFFLNISGITSKGNLIGKFSFHILSQNKLYSCIFSTGGLNEFHSTDSENMSVVQS